MPLTRDFRETVKASAARDTAFRVGLYEEAVRVLLDGDLGAAKILRRDVVNATVGFAELGHRVDVRGKSLMRMFGPMEHPRAECLVAVVAALREECRVSLTVRAAPLRGRLLDRRSACRFTPCPYPNFPASKRSQSTKAHSCDL